MTEASYQRTALPGRGPLMLTAGFMPSSMRSDLELLAEKLHLLDIRGPADIASMTVTFEGRSAVITPEITKGGAVRLVFKNAGWPADIQAEFERAFFDTFNVPVNMLIDPSVISLGDVGVFAYLLGGACANTSGRLAELHRMPTSSIWKRFWSSTRSEFQVRRSCERGNS